MSAPDPPPTPTSPPRLGPGAWDRRQWHPRPGFALRTHRRVVTGYGRRRSRPAQLLGLLTGAAGARRFVPPPPSHLEAFAAATGVGTDEQERRLRILAAHGVPPGAALRLGLIRDGWLDRWPEFVWDALVGWNLAASGRGLRGSLAALSDKSLTNRRLAAVGLPTVAGVELPRGARLEAIRDALDAHGSLFVKPRDGSRGRDSFVVDAGLVVTAYQACRPVVDASAALSRVLAVEPVLVQPRLRSHRDFTEAADPHDVTTLRVVTRWHGTRSTVFSAALELPNPLTQLEPAYTILGVGTDGTIRSDVRPPWVAHHQTASSDAVQDLVGSTLPQLAEAIALAPAAHRQFPGAFAVAWDVALSVDGPRFLEGNTGFGTVVPQWLSGGLLAGVG